MPREIISAEPIFVSRVESAKLNQAEGLCTNKEMNFIDHAKKVPTEMVNSLVKI